MMENVSKLLQIITECIRIVSIIILANYALSINQIISYSFCLMRKDINYSKNFNRVYSFLQKISKKICTIKK